MLWGHNNSEIPSDDVIICFPIKVSTPNFIIDIYIYYFSKKNIYDKVGPLGQSLLNKWVL